MAVYLQWSSSTSHHIYIDCSWKGLVAAGRYLYALRTQLVLVLVKRVKQNLLCAMIDGHNLGAQEGGSFSRKLGELFACGGSP